MLVAVDCLKVTNFFFNTKINWSSKIKQTQDDGVQIKNVQ